MEGMGEADVDMMHDGGQDLCHRGLCRVPSSYPSQLFGYPVVYRTLLEARQ